MNERVRNKQEGNKEKEISSRTGMNNYMTDDFGS